MAIQLDDSWKHKAGPIYYQHSKRKWYCVNCEYETKSPNGANSHAASHGEILPSHRKKEKVEEKPIIQAQIEPKKEKKSQITYTRKGSIFDVIGKNPPPQQQNSNLDSVNEAKKNIEEKKQLEVLGIKQLRAEGYLSEEDAQIGVLKIIWPEHLPSFLKDLKEKKEKEKRQQALMQDMFVRMTLRQIRNQT